MSDPKEHRELDLDAETVKDLEPADDDSEGVRGGALDPYLNLKGQKQGGQLTEGCPKQP